MKAVGRGSVKLASNDIRFPWKELRCAVSQVFEIYRKSLLWCQVLDTHSNVVVYNFFQLLNLCSFMYFFIWIFAFLTWDHWKGNLWSSDGYCCVHFLPFLWGKIVNMIFKNIQRSWMSLLKESLNAAEEVFDLWDAPSTTLLWIRYLTVLQGRPRLLLTKHTLLCNISQTKTMRFFTRFFTRNVCSIRLLALISNEVATSVVQK